MRADVAQLEYGPPQHHTLLLTARGVWQRERGREGGREGVKGEGREGEQKGEIASRREGRKEEKDYSMYKKVYMYTATGDIHVHVHVYMCRCIFF